MRKKLLSANIKIKVAEYVIANPEDHHLFNEGYKYDMKSVDNGDGTYTVTLYSTRFFSQFTCHENTLRINYLAITSKITNMSDMFQSCTSLTSINTSNWDTSNVTDMLGMFQACFSLKSLDLSTFNTSNVTNMSYMFSSCNSLTSLNLSSFNTSNVTDMYHMFSGCTSLTSLNLYNFNTSNVTNMHNMFNGCSSLTSLNLSSFNTSSVTNMYQMFTSVPKTVNWHYDGTNYTNWTLTESNTGYSGTFPWSTYYMEFTVNDAATYAFDGKNVRPMLYSYSNDGYYPTSDMVEITLKDGTITNDLSTTLNNIAKVKITYPEDIYKVKFYSQIKTLDYINTDNFTDMSDMFEGCINLTSVDLSNTNASNVTNMSNMFHQCPNLTSVDLSNTNTSKVTNMSNMFYMCSKLTSLNLSNFNTSNVSNMSYMFRNCSSLTPLDLSSFNTSKVTDMSYMFNSCSKLTSLNLSNFNTSNVTTMYSMFNGCTSLTSLNLSNFNTSKVTDMGDMFFNCISLTSLNLSNFDTSKVTSRRMLYNVPKTVNWHYDGTNYTNWTLTESDTSYSGTFPWTTVYTITVYYVDEEGNTIYEPRYLDYIYNDTYDLTGRVEREIEGYEFVRVEGSLTGVITSSISINVVYKIKTCTIIVNYIDENNNIIYEPQYFDYSYNNTYDLTGRVEREIDGYEFVKVEGSLTGVITSSISINVVYKVESSSLYIEYTISAYNDTDKIDALGSSNTSWKYYRRYLPRKYSASGSEIKTFDIIVKMIDGTATTISYNGNNSPSSSILACYVSSIMIEYESGEWFSFYGYNNSTYNHRLTGFIVPPKITKKTTRIDYMFRDCTLLTSLDVSNWDTSNVTDMYNLFDTPNLTTLTGIENWNVSNVTDMGSLFSDCGKLNLLDLSSWDTTNATSYSSMFKGLPLYCTIYIGDKWNPNMTESETGFKGKFITK